MESIPPAPARLPRRRLQRAMWPLVVVVPVILVLTWGVMEVLSASRAYIAAEGHWSRAQKDAVIALLRYAQTQAPADYVDFQQAMQVPLGDRRAREELDKPQPDWGAVRNGFLAGRNAEQDIDKLVWLYRNHRDVDFVGEAVRIWQATDRHIDALWIAGSRIHERLRGAQPDLEAIALLAAEVHGINAALGPLQQRFSATLSRGYRTVQWLLFVALALTGFAMLAIAWASSRQMIRHVLRAQEELGIAERAVATERDRALVTLQSIGDAVITANAEGRIDYLNPVAERLTGWDTAEAHGRPIEEVVRIVDEHGGNPIVNVVEKVSHGRGPTELARKATLLRRDGTEVAIAESASRIRARSGEAMGVVLVFRDVSRERRLAAQLSYHASHDALTGLVNRLEFERRLHLALQAPDLGVRSRAMLYIDLDRFKIVNDSCGHAAGDELLRRVSGLFAADLRESDTLARLGGDEFGVLLENCSPEDALRIAGELRKRIEEFRFVHGEQSFSIGASIGVLPLDRVAPTVREAMAAADRACYAAKGEGRNQVQLYRADTDQQARETDMDWAGRLSQALSEHRLRLYAQEIRPLKAAAHGPALEIFVRMEEESGNLIAPGSFIPAAERYGLMPQVDRCVIRQVLQCARDAQAAGLPVPLMLVNLSSPSLLDPQLTRFVARECEETGVGGEYLCFEFGESAITANLAQAQRFMHELRELGCRFCLDEVGRGLAAFGYARSLPIDYIKIDGLFVRNMAQDALDKATVEAINRIAHVMGAQTIAQMVEDQPTLDAATSIGTDYAQGFGIGRLAELEVQLRVWSRNAKRPVEEFVQVISAPRGRQ